MDGDRETETPVLVVQWLAGFAGWSMIIALCLLFWLGLYRLAIA
jgi:hypothetical protein